MGAMATEQQTIDEAVLGEVVAAMLGPGAVPGRWAATPLDYEITSPGTALLTRVAGEALVDGAVVPWSLLVKRVHSMRHSPIVAFIPEPLREMAIRDFPWRSEVDAYTSDLAGVLPEGLRLPVVYRVQEHGDDRVTLWREDVDVDPDAEWGLPRYARAAELLGRLAARRRAPAGMPPSNGTRVYVAGRIGEGVIPALREDATWDHPLVAPAADANLRADLLKLADRAPELLDALDTLPCTYVHGDACPQNLLVTRDDPDGFVAIDWTWPGVEPVGFDLAQLLAGGGDAGRLDPAQLADVHATILAGYLNGLAAEGMDADPAQVELGYVATLVLRSAFTSIPVERLGLEPTDALRTLVARRLAYGRFLADLGLALRA